MRACARVHVKPRRLILVADLRTDLRTAAVSRQARTGRLYASRRFCSVRQMSCGHRPLNALGGVVISIKNRSKREKNLLGARSISAIGSISCQSEQVVMRSFQFS